MEPSASQPPALPSRGPLPWRGKWLVLLGVTLAVVALDQWSKRWAHQDLRQRAGRRMVLVEGYLDLAYVRNPGAAWGFLARADESFRRPFFVAISVVAMGFILYLFRRLERGQILLLWALSLVMGGAVGNFIDRLRQNYVVDFIDFHVEQRFKWPTFNVADIAISIGVGLLLLEMFLLPWLRRRGARSAPGQQRPSDEG